MKTTANLRYILFIIPWIFLSCAGGGEVVVVEDEPQRGESQTEEDTTTVAEDTLAADFKDFKIGYVDNLKNLDPLFADNIATFRTLTLLYEGLFSLDENGEPQPQLASTYEVSEDSLTYSFTIHKNIFFHDNEVFSAGVGRRLVSTDVKYAFERTAHLNVPPLAAELFMNIEGYELFFNEQRHVYDPSNRILNGAAGIQTPNDSTIVINLENPDPDFLTKLSSPYAVIYPGESVRSPEQNLSGNPVGTGRYVLNRITEDNNFILTQNDNYWGGSRNEAIRFNRIDIKIFETEGKLFQEFAKKEIDIIPDPGPETINQVLDSDGNLTSAYTNLYKMIKNTGVRKGYFAFNESFEGNLGPLLSRIHNSGDLFDSVEIFGIEFNVNANLSTDFQNGDLNDSYLAPFTENLFTRKILVDLSDQVLEPVSQFQLMDVRVVSEFTSIHTNELDHFHYDRVINPYGLLWFEYSIDHFSLVHSYVSGYRTNGIPWWLLPSSIRVGDRQINTL